MDHDGREAYRGGGDKPVVQPLIVGEAELKHLLDEANRTWDVLQHDLEGLPHHPAA